MTETSQRQTLTLEHDGKIDEFDRKSIFGQIHLVTVCHCGNIYSISDFRSYSPINVCRCGNIDFIFGQVHHVNVRCCQFFGHIHLVILIWSSD